MDPTAGEPAGTAEDLSTWERVSLHVNGRPTRALVPAHQRLVAFLREELELTGTKIACEVGVCGVCTVLVDGRPISSCLALTVQMDGADVTTIEGVAARPDLRPLLEAFVTEGGYQCGFCTSGQIVAAAALLDEVEGDDLGQDRLREHMQGNLCRCTGYYGIERAVRKAAR
jgi:aerobic carbon-monoxide dehydrogenase small subunit